MAREFAKQFYSSKVWQDCRDTYSKRVGHLCEECLKKGIYTPGVIVHHIEELTPLNINNPEIALNYENLKLVCRQCHACQHGQGRQRRYKFDNFGNIIVTSEDV